jgi:hypothetical protein
VRSADPLAILPAYNEADVIGAVLEDLIAQGCQVHVLDNLSTDGTAEIARSLLGRGVVAVELFVSDRYTWAAMLRRVEEIALSSTSAAGSSWPTPTSSASPPGRG